MPHPWHDKRKELVELAKSRIEKSERALSDRLPGRKLLTGGKDHGPNFNRLVDLMDEQRFKLRQLENHKTELGRMNASGSLKSAALKSAREIEKRLVSIAGEMKSAIARISPGTIDGAKRYSDLATRMEKLSGMFPKKLLGQFGIALELPEVIHRGQMAEFKRRGGT